MRALNNKLRRDLVAMRGQSIAIALVIACGVMAFIIFRGSLDALTLTKEGFYQEYQFAEVFAPAKRVPEHVSDRIRDVSGVNVVETRVTSMIHLEVPGFDEPVLGAIQSLPDGRQPVLNRLHLRTGSLPDPARDDQVLVSDGLAEAHGLDPGDRIEAIINGRYHRLDISGIALSPEHVYQIGPADFIPDYERYGVLWMNRRGLATALGMDGAFNSVTLSLQAGASTETVIAELDRILAPYGGTGAHDRSEQMSHRFLQEELDQLQNMANVVPVLFLAVAAFLLNVVVTRMIRTQKMQIAVLKAFGYDNRTLVFHYSALTGVIVIAGAALGVALGAWLASAMAGLYAEFFRFPELVFRLEPRIALTGVFVAAAAAFIGTFAAVRSAVTLPPAEAMRPPAPASYRRGFVDKGPFRHLFGQASRMILRNIARHPVKAALSIAGIGLAMALLMFSSYQRGAISYMIDVQYRLAQRMDLHVAFSEPTSARAAGELLALEGVHHVESYRTVPVRLRNGHREYLTSLQGLPQRGELRRVLDENLEPVVMPDEGILVTDYLAEYLGIRPGDSLEVEIMEGHRRTVSLPVAGLVREMIGLGAYIERHQLNRVMGEGDAISGAWLLADRDRLGALQADLRGIPRIVGVGQVAEAGRRLQDYLDETVLVFTFVMLLIAGVVAFAVVYNNARINFAERERELATLRVLGFTRGEVRNLLVGETGILTLVALPFGWLMGIGFCLLISEAFSSDLFRIPFILTPSSFAYSALGVLLATGLSLVIIGRRINRLDMVSALKDIE